MPFFVPHAIRMIVGRIFPDANLVDYTAYMLKALDAENVTYILEGGALLGAFRHGGFIPGMPPSPVPCRLLTLQSISNTTTKPHT